MATQQAMKRKQKESTKTINAAAVVVGSRHLVHKKKTE
jgi:hypothetical protein